MKKISIIIPVYNVDKYITSCILSIKAQTYTGPIECIFIDDCSPDNSKQIIEDLFKECPSNITWKIISHTKNKGLSAARNTGILQAKGDYIYFLDSDDTISSDCLEVLSGAIKGQDYDFVTADFKVEDKYAKDYSLNHYNGTIADSENILDLYINRAWHVMACNKLCNLQFIKNNNLFFKEGLIHEDLLWSFQLACCAEKIHAINKKTYNYIIRENSIITQKGNDIKHFKAFCIVIEEIKRTCIKNDRLQLQVYKYLVDLSNSVLYKNIYSKSLSYNECYNCIRSTLSEINAFKIFVLNKTKVKSFLLGFHFDCPFYLGLTISYIISYFKYIKRYIS